MSDENVEQLINDGDHTSPPPTSPPGQEPADTVPDLNHKPSVEEQVEDLETSRMPAGTLDDDAEIEECVDDEKDLDAIKEGLQDTDLVDADYPLSKDELTDGEVAKETLDPEKLAETFAPACAAAAHASISKDEASAVLQEAHPDEFKVLIQVPAYDKEGRVAHTYLGPDTEDNNTLLVEKFVKCAVNYLSQFTKSQISTGTLVFSVGGVDGGCSSECPTLITRKDLTELVTSFLQNVRTALES